MWILRFHLLQTKDYNKLARVCNRYGFVPRKYSVVPFCKSLIQHTTQKTSWRALGKQYGIDHISLYKFYHLSQNSNLMREIFHIFLEGRIALYIGENKNIHIDDLNNSTHIYDLTKNQFESIL